MADGPGFRTDHDLERAVVHLHALEDPGGKLSGFLEFVAGVGDLAPPPLAVDLPRIELGDTTGKRPRQSGLPRDGDRLSRRDPRVEPLQVFQDSSGDGRDGTPGLVEVDDLDRLFHELVKLRVTIPKPVSS